MSQKGEGKKELSFFFTFYFKGNSVQNVLDSKEDNMKCP